MNPERRVVDHLRLVDDDILAHRSGRVGCSLENRYLAPMLITCILAAGQLSFGVLESYARTALAILTALVHRSSCWRGFSGGSGRIWPAPTSPGSASGFWSAHQPYGRMRCAVCCRSPRNMSCRSRAATSGIPPTSASASCCCWQRTTVASLSIQWGNYLPPMLIVWILGSIIIWQACKRFHICATYVVSFLLFACVRSWITGHPFLAEVAPITGPMYQLFIFFMITDPKTTVQTTWGQCVVAFLVALVEMLLRLNESVYAPLLRALPGWAERQPDRNLVAGTAVCHGLGAQPGISQRSACPVYLFRSFPIDAPALKAYHAVTYVNCTRLQHSARHHTDLLHEKFPAQPDQLYEMLDKLSALFQK